MITKTYPLISLMALIILSTLIFTGCDTKQPPPATTAPEKAPDFALRDMSGAEVKLADLIGTKPLVLDFWASWCSYCKTEIPNIIELHNNYKDKINIVGINLDRSLPDAQNYTQKAFIPYPNLYDGDGKVANTYGVFGIPHIIIINEKGEIVKRNATLADVKALIK